MRLQTRSVQQGLVKSKTVYLWSCGTVTSRRTRRPQYFSSLEGHIGKKNFRSILRPVNEDTSGGTQKRPLAFLFFAKQFGNKNKITTTTYIFSPRF